MRVGVGVRSVGGGGDGGVVGYLTGSQVMRSAM